MQVKRNPIFPGHGSYTRKLFSEPIMTFPIPPWKKEEKENLNATHAPDLWLLGSTSTLSYFISATHIKERPILLSPYCRRKMRTARGFSFPHVAPPHPFPPDVNERVHRKCQSSFIFIFLNRTANWLILPFVLSTLTSIKDKAICYIVSKIRKYCLKYRTMVNFLTSKYNRPLIRKLQ